MACQKMHDFRRGETRVTAKSVQGTLAGENRMGLWREDPRVMPGTVAGARSIPSFENSIAL